VAGKDHLIAACSSHDWIEKKKLIRFPPVGNVAKWSNLGFRLGQQVPESNIIKADSGRTKSFRSSQVFSVFFSLPLFAAQDFALPAQ
jgi:hypothetical protein